MPIRFVMAGGFAAVVNFCTRIGFSKFISYPSAIVLAYLCGMITAFTLNRRYVFEYATNPVREQAVRFVAVNMFALAQTLAVSLLLAGVVFPRMGLHWHDETLAHAVGVATPMVTSYLAHRHFTFR